MKKLFGILILVPQLAFAQIPLPVWSSESKTRQTVGYTTFEIRYGRPAARQRKIMGDLVPFERLWRTGAGRVSTISFDRQVTIGDKAVGPGTYALITIPGQREWTVMLNSDTTKLYGHPSEHDPARDVVRITATPERTGRFYESLTIELDIIKYDAHLYLSWENTQIHFPIRTGAHAEAMARIRRELDAHPDDPARLGEASMYYTMNNEDSNQVLRWLEHAITHGGDRWVYHQKVDVLAGLRRYAEARKAAGEAIAFLSNTRPVEWEEEARMLEEKMKKWPGK